MKKGEEPDFIRWNKILERVRQAARLSMVADVSATPWYGSGSTKETGTLYEWLVSDFSVYDAFESGLVKVVRLPDPHDEGGQPLIDVFDKVREAKTPEDYIFACRGSIAALYSSWKAAYEEWDSTLWKDVLAEPSPVMLVVASDGTRAQWLYDHLTRDYDLLRNPNDADEDPAKRVTIQVDSKVFDANQGEEAVLREMVSTVGRPGRRGELVRCIVSVNMLSEGWDVKSVTHILGIRAFGSPLLTEQVIGRGLRRTSYDVLNQPLDERPEGPDETVDVFGIPFVGFPVQRRKRSKAGTWGQKPITIEPVPAKAAHRVVVPNVRTWALGTTVALSQAIRVHDLQEVVIDPKQTPPQVWLRPVVGNAPSAYSTLAEFRAENPPLKVALEVASDLYEALNPARADGLEVGPTFEELLDVARTYLERRLRVLLGSDQRDAGIYFWRQQIVNVLRTAIAHAGVVGTKPLAIAGSPPVFDTEALRRFQWTGLFAEGKKCHTTKVPCHSPLEKDFAEFLDRAPDVVRYVKNERFGFSVTYYESQRPRQYFPDFIVATRAADSEVWWVVETKGEVHSNTGLKSEAARLWCGLMTAAGNGTWRYLFVQQREIERAMMEGVKRLSDLAGVLDRVGVTSSSR